MEQQKARLTEQLTLSELIEKVEAYHREYMKQEGRHTPKDDCKWILTVCSMVFLHFWQCIKEKFSYETWCEIQLCVS